MKSVGIVCVALLLWVGLVAPVAAAERPAAAKTTVSQVAVSQNTLASMGLGTAQALSDAEGRTIRGMGFDMGGRHQDYGNHCRASCAPRCDHGQKNNCNWNPCSQVAHNGGGHSFR